MFERDASSGNAVLAIPEQKAELIDLGLAVEAEGGEYHAKELKGSTVSYDAILRQEMMKLNKDENYKLEDITYNKQTETYGAAIVLAELYRVLDFDINKKYEEWGEDTFIIQDPNHPMIKNNMTLPRDILMEVLTILRDMTASDRQKRITLEQAIEKLEVLEKKYLTAENPKSQVVMIDVNDFANTKMADEIIEKLQMKQRIHKMDEVWLGDTSNSNDMERTVRTKLELEKIGMPVGNKVFRGSNPRDLKLALEETLKQRTIPAVVEFLRPKAPQKTIRTVPPSGPTSLIK